MRVWLIALLCLGAPRLAGADAPPRPEAKPDAKDDIQDRVAAAVFEQAVKLYHKERYADARELFLEAIAASPNGPYAKSARAMIRRCEDKLGIRPTQPVPPDDTPTTGLVDDEPVDPYADDPGVQPEDPYAEDPGVQPENPYAELDSPPRPPGGGENLMPDDPYAGLAPERPFIPIAPARRDTTGTRAARRSFLLFGGAYGFFVGFAGVNASRASEETVVPVSVMGGLAGMGTAYLLTRDRAVSESDAAVVTSGTAWGTFLAGVLAKMADNPSACDGDPVVFCPDGPEDQPESDYYAIMIAGSAAGLGTAIWYARMAEPSTGDVALVNSFGLYGAAAGLFLAYAMEPAQDRAFALNGLVGAGVGLLGGVYLAGRTETSRKRMMVVDLAAAGGAAAGWIIGRGAGEGKADGDRDQIAGTLALTGMAIGGGVAWWTTRDKYKPDARAMVPAPPALLARDASGWHVGSFVPAPLAGARGVGVPLVSGTW